SRRYVVTVLATLFADPVAHVDARQVRHGELAHWIAQVGQGFVHLLGCGSLVHQRPRLGTALVQHAVAHEAVAVANQYTHLVDPLGHRHHGCLDLVGGLAATHVLQQLHDVGRAEEVHTHHVFRTLGGRGDFVDAQGRRVGRQDGAGFADLIQLGDVFILDGHVLEINFDHIVHFSVIGLDQTG